MRSVRWAVIGCLILAPGVASAEEVEVQEIQLRPPHAAPWGIRNVGAAVTSVFGLWGYWYGENSITIETVPADAELQLFYIRANFQKRFERVQPPVRVVVPTRINATTRDALIVRVVSNGFRGEEITYDIHELPRHVVLELQPLPNSLVFLGHSHLAGRSTLTLRTRMEPQFRVMRTRGAPGLTLSLTETADGRESRPQVAGGYLSSVEVTQAGEDLLIRVDTGRDGLEVRSKTSYDPVREEHSFLLEFLSEGSRPPSARQIQGEFERLGFRPNGCDARFEELLRARVDERAIARAHRPSGGLGDLYRRAAMLSLGRMDLGTVRTSDGEVLRTGSPLELELALRSLLAPDVDPEGFASSYREAESAWTECRG
jgi:hypothetical protein